MFKKILLVLLVFASAFALVACDKKPETKKEKRETGVNNEYTLLLQASEMDGVFNPFFYSSAYDGDVIGMVNASLLTLDDTGAVVAGDKYPTVALDYSIYYTNNLTTYAKKDTYSPGDHVVYDIVLKNGAKFSDGAAITADDVLFNMYTYLDPAYVGSSTLYTLPIRGLANYRAQLADLKQFDPVLDALLETEVYGSEYVATDKYTEAEFNTFWSEFDIAGARFAQDITNYVMKNYGTKQYVDAYAVGMTLGEILRDDNLRTAFGMRMWGFGSFQIKYTEATDGNVVDNYGAFNPANPAHATAKRYNEVYEEAAEGYYAKITEDKVEKYVVYDAKKEAHKTAPRYDFVEYAEAAEGALVRTSKAVYNAANPKHVAAKVKYTGEFQSFTTSSGDVFNSANLTDLNAEVYFQAIMDAYEGDYKTANESESAGADLVALARERYILANANVGEIPNITGLQKTTTKVNGVDHEVVRVVLTQQNPKAILSLGVTVAPKHYYTLGYTYKSNGLSNFGVDYNSDAFMDHLKSFNAAPRGAGPYKFVSRDGGDGTVFLERNDYFETMGGANVHNAYIKKVAFKIVESGSEYTSLEAKAAHYATVSATADVMTDIGTQDELASILVDNLGYGYIAINPYVYNDINERVAIQSLLNLAKVYEYYPNGLADVIYRSQSQVSWAYPEGAEVIPGYGYDATMATAIARFKAAGYTYDEATKKFTDVPKIVMTIPSAADAHPAGGIFLDAKKLLDILGIENEIAVDANLIANIKTGEVGIYALAWQAAADPDMYQVYHHQSQAESVVANGIAWLYKNGDKNDLGTIEVTKLDGTKVTMNQKQALAYLAELIEEGVKFMLAEERAPIYEKALEVLAQLAIEIPTYQRKNLFVYNSTIIDGTSLSNVVTPYWGPLSEIWKVKFAKGTTGNLTETVNVPVK